MMHWGQVWLDCCAWMYASKVDKNSHFLSEWQLIKGNQKALIRGIGKIRLLIFRTIAQIWEAEEDFQGELSSAMTTLTYSYDKFYFLIPSNMSKNA